MEKISCIIANSVTLVSMEWSRCEIMQRDSILITGKNENSKDKSKRKSRSKRKRKSKKKHHSANLKYTEYPKG
jgi:hypothetical protein